MNIVTHEGNKIKTKSFRLAPIMTGIFIRKRNLSTKTRHEQSENTKAQEEYHVKTGLKYWSKAKE